MNINEIINKIKEIPYDTDVNIAELINYNPEEKFVDPMTQMQLLNQVFDEAKKEGIYLEENQEEIGGLGFYVKIKKIDNNQLKKFMDDFINQPLPEQTELDKEFDKYCELYKEKFGKNAYVAEPSGTKEKTIDAIKECLEKNEDILDKILYPNFEEDMNNGNLY